MQVTRTDSKTRGGHSILGVICFIVGGFIASAWGTYALWEVAKAPVDIGLLAVFSGLVGALSFGIIGLGMRLIVR
jgi:hypothetical protein